MRCSTRSINCNNALCALLLLSQPIARTGFVPRNVAAGEAIARRTCDPARPDVSESSIIVDVCNQTLANDSPCSDQMTVHMQQSATNTCGQYFGLYTNCLVASNDDHTACSDSLLGYHDCHNYTMQAYAYCACYHTVPALLADCANEQLQPQPQGTGTVSTASAPLIAVPTHSTIVASAATADKEPLPAALTVSREAALPSSQRTISFSEPRLPSAPTVHMTTLKSAMPSTDPSATRTRIATPSTMRTEPFTVVTTHTTTSPATAHTTTATATPASIRTVYTCANNDGGGGDGTPPPALAPAASALTHPTTSIARGPETSAPHSGVLPAQSTRASMAAGSTTRIGIPKPSTSLSYSSSSSTATPALAPSTGVLVPSEVTAGRSGSGNGNGGAVCARCRRRSKLF